MSEASYNGHGFGEAEISKLRARPCLLCGAKPVTIIGVFVCKDGKDPIWASMLNIGIPKEELMEAVAYGLCTPCMNSRKDNSFEVKIEDALLKDLRASET